MRALITGITSQDGSYLSELLLRHGYEVYGMARNCSLEQTNPSCIPEQVRTVEGDLGDQSSIDLAIQRTQPDEVYNLAAQSFVPVSWKQPVMTADITGIGVLRILEAIRKYAPKAKFLQASSSEMFGKARLSPQTETTPFHPCTPYGVAKVFGYQVMVNYRETYGLFACSSICFNHESPRRRTEFVTRKVTQHAARIKRGLTDRLKMGNLEARRDWGFAGDYVRAMWLMLQQSHPDDFVIATGQTHTIRELLDIAFSYLGLDWTRYVELDPKLVRPAEVEKLCGDSAKAHRVLGWRPQVDFRQLVQMMVDSDLASVDAAQRPWLYAAGA
jgi:GDPmannose 4,6-dehydratase